MLPLSLLLLLPTLVLALPLSKRVSGIPGLDVSSYQGSVSWSTVASDGAKFAYIKATESTDYVNPDFAQQYDGSYDAGLIRGAYHFAHPDESTGSAQASYFLSNGGGWSADGLTLPGMLDLEYNPDGAECYSLSQSSMASWISEFSSTYHAGTGRYPVIYTTADWWDTCVDSSAFGANSALFIADYASEVGSLPTGWSYYSFWQYADSGTFPGDQDVWNGSEAALKKFATG